MTSLSPLLRTKLSPRFRISTFHIPLSSSPISQSVSCLTTIGLLGFKPSRTYSTDTNFLEDVSKRFDGATQRPFFTIRQSSVIAIKRKSHLETTTFSLHDAIEIQSEVIDNKIFHNWRTVMQVKNNLKTKHIPRIFGWMLPNMHSIVKPLELITNDHKLFIVYDHCGSSTFIEHVKGNFTTFVTEGVILLSPAMDFIRTLIQVALSLEKYECQYYLNEKLIFRHEDCESAQILLDIFGGKDNFNVIADVVEAYFGKAEDSYELAEFLLMLRKGEINRENIDYIAALATAGTITRRLSCVSEALTRNMGFRMRFNEKYYSLNGWKRLYPKRLEGYSNSPYSLIKCFRNMCFHKQGTEFCDSTTMEVINIFRRLYPSIILILFSEFENEGLTE